MNRRRLLTAIGGLGLTGASALALGGDLPGARTDDAGLPPARRESPSRTRPQ